MIIYMQCLTLTVKLTSSTFVLFLALVSKCFISIRSANLQASSGKTSCLSLQSHLLPTEKFHVGIKNESDPPNMLRFHYSFNGVL
jgi:hypothetical protein